MSLATIESDVAGWASDIGGLLSSATPVLGEIEAAFNAVSGVAKVISTWQSDMQTPEMINASTEEKLKAFQAQISTDLATGNEADTEVLEGGS